MPTKRDGSVLTEYYSVHCTATKLIETVWNLLWSNWSFMVKISVSGLLPVKFEDKKFSLGIFECGGSSVTEKRILDHFGSKIKDQWNVRLDL